jgi:hypothetical protein
LTTFSTGVIKIHAITGEYLDRLSSLLCEGKPPIDKRGKSTTGNEKPGLFIRALKKRAVSFLAKLLGLHCTNRKMSKREAETKGDTLPV